MTVAVRAEPGLGVVDVQAAQPVEPDPVVELGDRRVERRRVGDVDPDDVPVARVEADPEPRVVVEAVVDRGELVGRAADRAAGAGRVLHQEPEVVVRQLEQLPQRGNDPLEPGLESGAEMRADVEDDALGPDRVGRLERRAHRRDRLVVDLGVGARRG